MSLDLKEFARTLAGAGLDSAADALGNVEPKDELQGLVLNVLASSIEEYGMQGFSLAEGFIVAALKKKDTSKMIKELPAREASDLLVGIQGAALKKRNDAHQFLGRLGDAFGAIGLGILRSVIPA